LRVARIQAKPYPAKSAFNSQRFKRDDLRVFTAANATKTVHGPRSTGHGSVKTDVSVSARSCPQKSGLRSFRSG
jgi:hypothetical protein